MVRARLPAVAIGPHACQSGRGRPTLWLWSFGGVAGVWGSCPEPGEGEPVQEVTGAAAAAEAAVAVPSATAEAPASARAAQQTITGLENEPGRVSFGGSLEAQRARGPVQPRVLSSGRLERSSRAGPVGVQATLCSPLEPASRTIR